MIKYPKIETLFKRDKDTFKVIPILRESDSIEALNQLNTLIVEEKIDGANAHIYCTYDYNEGFIYKFFSRNNEIPFVGDDIMYIRDTLSRVVDIRQIKGWFLENFVNKEKIIYPEVRIYGEVFGEKIQGNPYTQSGRDFRVFDISINDRWLSPSRRHYLCKKLNLKEVPLITTIHAITFEEIYNMLFHKFSQSVLAKEYGKDSILEGFIIRPSISLYTNRGRVIGKIKRKDFSDDN